MTADLIHTDLTPGEWAITNEVAPIRDNITGIATVRQPLTIRGSRQQAVRAFPYGAQNCPQGGPGMFCLGPSDIQLVPNTGANPHWDLMVEWVGLHNQFAAAVGADTTMAYNAKIDWAFREKEYPEEIPTEAGDPIRISPAYPFAPSGSSTGGALRKSKRFDHLPTASIDVVMRDATAPHPGHPKVKKILSLLQTSWPGVIYDYKGLSEPVWVTWSDRPAPKTIGAAGVTNSAKWFPRQIANAQRIAPIGTAAGTALHVFTITATLEPLLQPS